MLPLVYNGVEIGTLHYRLSMAKPVVEQQKGYLKHNKNVES